MRMCCFTRVAFVFAFGLCVQGYIVFTKPGKCPRIFNTLVPAQPCEHDGCCPGQEKCCMFVGGSVCAPPILTQPGCPDIKGKVGVCAELCSCDSDCKHGEKCCFNGCGHECIATNPEKPGSCRPSWFSFLCSHPCRHDSDCPGKKKCCPTLCSFSCQEPYQPHCS